ncbi:MAG: hypothetical protein ACWGQW_12865 [bacterium]
MPEYKVTPNIFYSERVKMRMKQLEGQAEKTGKTLGIFVKPDATDLMVSEGSFYIADCNDPPVGMVEVWNTDDGELI